MRRIIILFLIHAPGLSFAQAIYFQNGSEILKCTPDLKSTDIVWSAPFDVFDVSVNHDGTLICFTRWEDTASTGKELDDPRREVGFYSPIDKKITILRSTSHYNFGAVISPNDSLIAFNSLIGSGDWETAVYDRTNGQIRYGVDSASVYGWDTDSTLLLTSLEGIVRKNVRSGVSMRVPLPDTSIMDISVPGTQMLQLDDSTSFFVCEDMVVSNPDFDGPIQNVFVTKRGATKRILDGIVDVNSCVLSSGLLYIDYTDYNNSKEGVHKLGIYDHARDSLKQLAPPGTLVGVCSN